MLSLPLLKASSLFIVLLRSGPNEALAVWANSISDVDEHEVQPMGGLNGEAPFPVTERGLVFWG
jgi:hypothetical protein